MEILHSLAAYAIPAALITMLPGPDTAMVLATAARSDRATTVRAAWGVGTGILVWGAAASLGLAALLRSSTILYDAFRLACAVYLIWLALVTLRRASHSSRHPRATVGPDDPPADQSRGRFALGWGYRRALLTCVLNPKLGVYFVVVLPQFVPSDLPLAPTTMLLSTLHAAEATCWYLLVGGLATTLRRQLSRPSVRRWLDRITASVFLGFGVRLAVESSR